MFKKIVSLLCCIFPAAVFAADDNVVTFDSGDVSASGVLTTSGNINWQNAISSGKTIRFNAGNTINDVGSTSGTALNLDAGMYIGYGNVSDADSLLSQPGAFYVMGRDNDLNFSIKTYEDISVGTELTVYDGWNFSIEGVGNPVNAGLIIGTNGNVATVDVGQNAVFELLNLDNVQINGGVTVGQGGQFNTSGINSLSVGAIETSGVVGVDVVGNVNITLLDVQSGATNTTIVSGGNIYVTDFVTSVSGNVGLTSDVSAAIKIDNGLSNYGLQMTLSKGNVYIGGDFYNAENSSILLKNLSSLTVNGNFINNGNIEAAVIGASVFNNGWNLSGMNSAKTFKFTTGTLSLGANNNLLNSLENLELTVTAGNLTLNSVFNQNANSGMSLSATAGTFSANYIENNGLVDLTESVPDVSLYINAGNVVLGDAGKMADTAILTVASANTQVVASGLLTVNGVVSNQGMTVLRSKNVQLADVLNSGEESELNIGSLTNTEGKIVVNNVTNKGGKTILYAKDIDINGVLQNTAGETIVNGSDTDGSAMQIGSLQVTGGQVTVNAVATDVAVGKGGISVNDGTLEFSTNVDNVAVDGNLYLNGVMNIQSPVFSISATDIEVVQGVNIAEPGRSVQFVSEDISVGGAVNVAQGSQLFFGSDTVSDTSELDINNSVTVSGLLGIYSNSAKFNSLNNTGLIRNYGNVITVDNGGIDIKGTVRFDADETYGSGLSLIGVDSFTLTTTNAETDIKLGALFINNGNILYLNSANDIAVSDVFGNAGSVIANATGDITLDALTTNEGLITLNAKNIKMSSINNVVTTSNVLLFADNGVSIDGISNYGVFKVAKTGSSGEASANLTVNGKITNYSGTVDLFAQELNVADIDVQGGTLCLYAPKKLDAGTVQIKGNLNQGIVGGAVNIINTPEVEFAALKLSGDFVADDNSSASYKITGVMSANTINIASGSSADFSVKSMSVSGIENNGSLVVTATNGITVSGAISNEQDNASVVLDSGAGMLFANDIRPTGGNMVLKGAGLKASDINFADVLYQNVDGNMFNIDSDTYVISSDNLNLAGINQNGNMTINSSNIVIGQSGIVASDLQIYASPTTNWMNVMVGQDGIGGISGNVGLYGLGSMSVQGDYIFNDNSSLMAAVLGKGDTTINYWADISLENDDTFGKLILPDNPNPLISVGGKFMSDVSIDNLGLADSGVLEDAQMGIYIFNMPENGTAIWLLKAEDGVHDISTKIRNINVKFCNADMSHCVPYFNDLADGLPAYISVRDWDDDGTQDSLFVVFDNRFGGPVKIFEVQPIVAREKKYLLGEYYGAGALDSLVTGHLFSSKFYNDSPIEVIPEIFKGTKFENIMTELYDRMEGYVVDRDGSVLANFSRLFANFEAEQAIGTMLLNEHTIFRSFEDRMFDEFIWNRNRKLKKAWTDIEFGMLYQNTLDGEHADGNRFNISGGFDWQESNTLSLGFTGHISRTSSELNQDVDLSYAEVSLTGNIDTSVSDTNIGFGAYLMKTLGEKYRIYGNAFLDAHLFDIQRNQNFVGAIDGNGSAFSLISEWGLMHDILNQYIVGNVYARFGYNFGMKLSEEVEGTNYMKTLSDGYLILTPGYSVIAQKRIYPTAWFQIRPYASVGVEYDVLGVPDNLEYKFNGAWGNSEYAVDFDPLWANIGGGVELLSAHGWQAGLDYRYQYNSSIQLHNIKLSGSYRF